MAKSSPVKERTSISAIAALVCGILSIFIGWIPFIGWSLILAAIIFGAVGISETRTRKGRWMAVTGLVLGILSIILMIAIAALALLFVTTASTEYSQTEQVAQQQIERRSYDDRAEQVIGETVRVISVDDDNTERSIDSEEPVELHITGSGNTVTAMPGTRIVAASVDGFDNTLIISAGAELKTLEDRGVNTEVIQED